VVVIQTPFVPDAGESALLAGRYTVTVLSADPGGGLTRYV